MQKPIKPISASTPKIPFTRMAESVSPSGADRDLNPDASGEDDRELTDASSSSVYGGTSASLDYPLRSAPTPNRDDFQAGFTPGTSLQTPANNWSISLQTVLDQPPATLPFRLMLGGMAFCIAFGAWATFGQIEDVGHAQGQLVPQGEPYKIHPVVSGKVASITVKEGDTVKAGQVLVELDNQIAANEVERLRQEQASYQTQLSQTQGLIDRTRLEAETHGAIADARIRASEAAIAQADAKVQGVQEAIALAKKKVSTTMELLEQLRTDADAYRNRRERLEPLTAMAAERLRELQANVDAQQARLKRMEPLVKEGAIAKERLFEVEQALRDRQSAVTQSELQELSNVKEQLFQAEQALRNANQSITQTQGEIQQSLAEANRLQAELKQALAEANRLQAEQAQLVAQKKTTQLEDQQKIQQLEVQKTQLQAKIDETEKLLTRARTELKQLAFTAPIDGVVLSLNLKHPGEVVQPGQTVAEVASQDAPLVLVARLPNREAGFVKTGMSVKVKFDAYPYQDYGIVSGKVTSVSPDAKPDERLGAVYRVEVALDRNFLTSKNQTIKFKPGQTATADIVIRERRIIDVLLDPIKQMQKGGLNL